MLAVSEQTSPAPSGNWTFSMMRALFYLIVVTLIAGGLTACGKRGQLEPPASQAQAAEPKAAPPAPGAGRKARAVAANAEEAPPASEPTRIGGKKRVPIVAPKRDLPIDWILE